MSIEIYRSYIIAAILFLFFLLIPLPLLAAPNISSVTDNRSSFSAQSVPKYSKFEITFQLNNLQASNYQLPYVAVSEGQNLASFADAGVSAEAVFTDPSGQTHRQPAFYYENFSKETRENKPWLYSNGQFSWKVRFSPNKAGVWSYKLTVIDKGGTAESQPVQFNVAASSAKGFIRASKTDSRYFEFEDGTYFPGLGYNIAVTELNDENNAQIFDANDIRLLRAWIAPLGIYGTSWTHWRMMPGYYDGYMPRVPVLNASVLSSPARMYYYVAEGSGWFEPCMFVGHEQPLPPVKPNTIYNGTISFLTQNITGPRTPGAAYGLTVKTGQWLDNCADSGSGTKLIPNEGNSTTFKTVNFSWNSGGNSFLPNFYVTLENVSAGQAYIKEISLKEAGVEVFDKPSPEQHLYMAQRRSYELDGIIETAEKYNLYIRPVIEEKNEHIFQKLDQFGQPTLPDSNNNYYGSGRTLSGSRFLHQAWWRYLQARWGYSKNIHSWELLNEGDPASTDHFSLADELGIYMNCRVFGIAVPYQDGANCSNNHPNGHMVSTSFWHSFPATQFWSNAKYPNIDFADVHAYISTGYAPLGDKLRMESDSSYYHTWYSADIGGWKIGKPVIRGEAGMDLHTAQDENNLGVQNDTAGIWLHNYLWASLHPGGLMESYWWTNSHIYNSSKGFDNRPQFKYFSRFISTIPLNNGNYKDIAAVVGNSALEVIGQRDSASGNAYFWVRNKDYNWKNAVGNVSITPQSGSVTVAGFSPGKQYNIEEWDTYTGTVKRINSMNADNSGSIVVPVASLAKDTAFKIMNPDFGNLCVSKNRGDADCDGKVNLSDFEQWRKEYTKVLTTITADFDGDAKVTIADFESWRAGYFMQP